MTSRRAETERCDHGFLKSQAHKLCQECSAKPDAPRLVLPADLTKLVFGKLTIDGPAQAGSRANWNCTCACGRQVVVNRTSLIRSLRYGYTSACPDCRTYTPKRNSEGATP